MRLIYTAFVTLDGVMEAPGFDEHRDGRNAWALRRQDPENQDWNMALGLNADAILLGRKSFQIWAAFWPTAPESPLRDKLNAVPKFVVSRTLDRSDWPNTTVLSGDVAAEVAALKARPGGELVMYGSAELLAAIEPVGLIDEYRLQVYPVILGSGKRLFADRLPTRSLRLLETRTFPNGVVLLRYEPDSVEPTTPYVEAYRWTEEQTRSLHAAQHVDRVLATVLFTDIVDSTARAAAMGDHAWRQLVDRHLEISKAEVSRWLGTHVESTGDGIMAVFDTPSRALQCAFALQGALAGLDLRIRAGLHVGEVERRDTGYGGIAVHLAARVAAQAKGDQVLVTRTVQDLSFGTRASFRSIGTFSLKGVPGEWELLEATAPEGG
ncbi:MAG TPA: dihydrofolate reductase family protein [Candidatus Limnocylindrales bacterium]